MYLYADPRIRIQGAIDSSSVEKISKSQRNVHDLDPDPDPFFPVRIQDPDPHHN